MKNYKFSLIGAIVAALFFLISILFDIDFFEKLIHMLDELEHLEIDELIIPIIIFLVFFVADMVHRNKSNKLDHERLKIYRAMVSSTHHVLNNLLNQMLIVKIKAEDTPGFDPKTLRIYDDIVREAEEQIHSLSNVEHVTEEKIKESVRPK